MKKTQPPAPNPLWQQAAMPPPLDPTIPKKNLSMRLRMHLLDSLESMAGRLGKTSSGLGAELLEAAIVDFSNNLSTIRPDLLRPLTRDEAEYEHDLSLALDDYEGSFLPRPSWLTPQEALERYQLQHPQTNISDEPED